MTILSNMTQFDLDQFDNLFQRIHALRIWKVDAEVRLVDGNLQLFLGDYRVYCGQCISECIEAAEYELRQRSIFAAE